MSWIQIEVVYPIGMDRRVYLLGVFLFIFENVDPRFLTMNEHERKKIVFQTIVFNVFLVSLTI